MKKWSRIILIMILTLTLTACGEKTYTVSFNPDGGNYVESQKIKENETVSVPTAPTKSGYTFSHWETANNVKYDFSAKVTESFTLYAKWIEGTAYVVSFNTDGGSYVDSQSVKENGTVVKPSTPTKEGYTFVRWELDGKEYDFKKPVTGAITLTAIWKESGETTTTKNSGSSDSKTTKKTTTKKPTTTTKKPTTTTTEAEEATYSVTKTDIGGVIPQSVLTVWKTEGSKKTQLKVSVRNQSGTEIATWNSSQNGAVGVTANIANASSYQITDGGKTITIKK